jgi:hypothetical protein
MMIIKGKKFQLKPRIGAVCEFYEKVKFKKAFEQLMAHGLSEHEWLSFSHMPAYKRCSNFINWQQPENFYL